MSEFDVFLSHNGHDKPLVRTLKTRLVEDHQLGCWLDEDQLRPGINWLPLLEEGIRASKSIAVLVGSDGLGPWEDEEMQAALRLAVKDDRPIIPVLLPNCPKRPDLPLFLDNRTWVDLREGYSSAGLARLVWGITGVKPDALLGEVEPDEAPNTPAQLWPERSNDRSLTDRADCYQRLHEICTRGEVPDGEDRKALWMAVKRDRPSSFLTWQLANIARWSAPEYLEVEERFTPLQVNVRVREGAEMAPERQRLPFDTLAAAMDAVFDEHMAPASVILAPPGGGKSTLLRHYHLNLAQHLADSDRLVFYVQLRDYRPDKLPEDARRTGFPALDWLATEWRKETRRAPPLGRFLEQRSLTLLLDGLNEIPRHCEEAYQARVAEWRDLIHHVEDRHPGVRLLFACRPLDYSQRLDVGRDARLPDIEVQAMEPERIKAFVDKRFERPVASQIWQQLEAHPSLELYSSPYYLNLLLSQIDPKATEVTIPQNRAALFSGMVRASLVRECLRGTPRFADPDLLSERDRTTLMSGRPRPSWLPDERPLFAALAKLAFHIQDASGNRDPWGSIGWNAARAVLEQVLARALSTDACLWAGYDIGLFEDDAVQAGDIRFVHQQMQEYFAAWMLAREPEPQRLAVPWKGAEIAESTERLLAQGGDDDLPELPATGWEESTLIAASLSDDPDGFIEALMPHHLALAGHCAAQPGMGISAPLRRKLQAALVARSQHPEADLRARIAAGKALGELGDPRLEAPHTRSRVALLLPPFAAIPGGEYSIGGDPEGFQSEYPAQPVSLAAFELAIHPVTNAEFACFVQAGGYQDDRWWSGQALEWRKGQIGQDALHRWFREQRNFILKDLGSNATPESIRDRYSWSLNQAKAWHEQVLSTTEKEFEGWLHEAHPPPAGPYTRPKYWRSLTWGNPAQPVVGVCWYEAQAYCWWLNAMLDEEHYRLPSEAEWEAAARGRGTWRRYAWSGAFDPLRANTAETRLGVTTPMGVFPSGVTPDSGLFDMCGNVLEWTATPWSEGEAWDPTLGPTSGEPDARRVVRGGSWGDTRAHARLGSRDLGVPDGRYSTLGFRVCRASPIWNSDH